MSSGAFQSGTVGSPAKPPASLLDDGGRVIERLYALLTRSQNIADRLHGARPRDANTAVTGATPVQQSLRHQIDSMQEVVVNLEQEFSTIENRL